MLDRLALCCVAFVLAAMSNARADEYTDSVCPVLESIAAGTAGKDRDLVRYEVLMQVLGAIEAEPEALRGIVADLEVSTAEACPEARSAVLDYIDAPSLASAMR